MTHAYCTYFDSGYLSRALALIESLRSHGDDGTVWVMALDDEVPRRLAELALPGVEVITVAELESEIPELAALKATRTRMEYYFTCTPLLVRHVMARSAPGTAVAYLDADLFFFGSPESVFAEMGSGSVGIIEHRYPAGVARRLAKYGRFNVGWVGFADDEHGRACLDWWGERTLEWCSDTPEDGKYADQGYLDSFPQLFDGVSILKPVGMDAAPWNSRRWRWTMSSDSVRVGGDPLVFFHFHGLRRVGSWWITAQLLYGAPAGRVLRDKVYQPYVRCLERWEARLGAAARPAARGTGLRGLLFRAQKSALTVLSIGTGNAVRVR
ncbi:MAG: hypothetical protein ABIP33_05735 [Pseudolysinimonas sp.]